MPGRRDQGVRDMMIHSSRLRRVMRSSGARTATRLAASTRAAVALEFGLIAIPFFALMIAVLQTSLVFFAQQTLETTAEKSARELFTGAAQRAGMSKTAFKTLVCSNLPHFMKCSNVLVDVQSASTFAGISMSAPTIEFDKDGNVSNSFVYSPGGAGSINIVRVMYIWDVQMGPLGFDLSTMSNKKRLLYTTSVFKTEPY